VAPACPLCDGDGTLLGQLGHLTWFRCRQCGMDFAPDPGELALLDEEDPAADLDPTAAYL
jgi:tRNA(Ile2) C34 agmatinyltransferase TiaS